MIDGNIFAGVSSQKNLYSKAWGKAGEKSAFYVHLKNNVLLTIYCAQRYIICTLCSKVK